ncbi:hypothetical protein AMECASPLE_002220 [Ameca splendens]|uniref:Uncharacterized protein n=1 Tax=Ameca splendens TaxID=208324 RepID=A0ABV0YKL3_9TELE
MDLQTEPASLQLLIAPICRPEPPPHPEPSSDRPGSDYSRIPPGSDGASGGRFLNQTSELEDSSQFKEAEEHCGTNPSSFLPASTCCWISIHLHSGSWVFHCPSWDPEFPLIFFSEVLIKGSSDFLKLFQSFQGPARDLLLQPII